MLLEANVTMSYTLHTYINTLSESTDERREIGERVCVCGCVFLCVCTTCVLCASRFTSGVCVFLCGEANTAMELWHRLQQCAGDGAQWCLRAAHWSVCWLEGFCAGFIFPLIK